MADLYVSILCHPLFMLQHSLSLSSSAMLIYICLVCARLTLCIPNLRLIIIHASTVSMHKLACLVTYSIPLHFTICVLLCCLYNIGLSSVADSDRSYTSCNSLDSSHLCSQSRDDQLITENMQKMSVGEWIKKININKPLVYWGDPEQATH